MKAKTVEGNQNDLGTRPVYRGWQLVGWLPVIVLAVLVLSVLLLVLYVDWKLHPNWKIVLIVLGVLAVLGIGRSVGAALENFDRAP